MPIVDPFRLQLEAFAAAAGGVAPPEPVLAESVVDAFTLEALLTSANERAAVAIEVPGEVRAALTSPSGRLGEARLRT
jgi:hypothetical protein